MAGSVSDFGRAFHALLKALDARITALFEDVVSGDLVARPREFGASEQRVDVWRSGKPVDPQRFASAA